MTNKELYDRIMIASEVIEKASRSKGSYIIVNSQVAEALENLDIKKQRKKKLKKLEEFMKKNGII